MDKPQPPKVTRESANAAFDAAWNSDSKEDVSFPYLLKEWQNEEKELKERETACRS